MHAITYKPNVILANLQPNRSGHNYMQLRPRSIGELPLQSPLVYIFQSPEYVTSKSTENKELDYITICQIHVAE